MNLDARKRINSVLEIIINHYIDTAEPVSSRYVARRLKLSSATIRNVMADLEDLGFITHPHTSAGRMPTDRGYRYYIDYLIKFRKLDQNMVRTIDDQYHSTVRSLENVLERTSHLLSDLTSYVGVTLLTQYDKIYLDGTSHILEQPEFGDVKKLYQILKCLEEKRSLLDILGSDMEGDNVTVRIGKEHHISPLNDCSIVTRSYKVKGKTSGKVGVIGPKRMLYDRVIPTIEILADTLTNILEEFGT